MMYTESTDTIAAVATPPGLGGIAILRISGGDALLVLQRLFVPASSSPAAFSFRPRYMHYGHALDSQGQILDEVLAVYMPGPHSATGEDVGEVHCHGGTGIAAALLEACMQAGARLAGAGEFTRRAFLNGRIDLTQAEAVAELISAPSRQGIRLAQAKLEGLLGQKVSSLREALDGLRIQITLSVDFPDEDAELLPRDAFAATVHAACQDIRALLAGFERARLWREGVTAVLAGRVNVGKSSLMNALLGRRRAIVSDEPGTTRDYIEESISLAGMPVRLIDTAGLREGGGLVEAEGMRFSRGLSEEADCLLLVVDGTVGLAKEDWDFLILHEQALRQGRVLLVVNKMDSEGVSDVRQYLHLESVPPVPSALHGELLAICPAFAVSAKHGHGLLELGAGIRAAVVGSTSGGTETQSDLAPNIRQAHLLEAALTELDALTGDLEFAMPPDILAVRLDAAVDFLDEVTGASSNEELLDRIFASFCIGK